MSYLEVVVNSPGGRYSTFVYSYDGRLSIPIGSLVLVPFGSSPAQGIVVDHPSTVPDVPIRPIDGLIDDVPVVSPIHIALARWIADHYCCSLFDALTPMLPPGTASRPRTLLSLIPGAELPTETTEGDYFLLEALRANRSLDLAQARRLLASHRLARHTDAIVRRLTDQGIIRRDSSLRPARVRPKMEWYARLAVPATTAEESLPSLVRASRQRDLLARLIGFGEGTWVSLSTIRDEGIGTLPVARALQERGVVDLEQRELRRDPLAHQSFPSRAPPVLTLEQDRAWSEIEDALDRPGFHPFLLHGITGSGKTEIYLRLIAALLDRGKRSIVLVPEIALTPQTIQRFAGRFPGRLAVLHSRLTPGERFDEWRRIRSGLADVVVGSRSAIFAPVQNLGGIVVDEEHEWSYKHERTPRFHARATALKLAELAGLTIVLGSATPSVESYYQATQGQMRLLVLKDRVASAREPSGLGTGLPSVDLVDLRAELRAGNRSIFSTRLHDAIELALSFRQQIILFLNRRGDSTFVLCRDCGHVMRCGRCDAPYVYHSDQEDLVCHLCDARVPVPKGCPRCWGDHIRYFGIGTQKLEAETRREFPHARVLRWDRDAARARGAHDQLMRAFTNHDADVIVGTQMIAKGLDLPLVTLVGVVSADMSLHLPDFRAAERTFQLITQVAGRAGRGPLGGKVIIQAYTPEHYTIQAARTHDFLAFYEHEIEFRQHHGYPPFGDVARLLLVGSGEERIQREAEKVAAQIRYVLRRDGVTGIDLIGPAPAFHHKVRGRYRWHIILRGRGLSAFLHTLELPPGWSIDVDPASTL